MAWPKQAKTSFLEWESEWTRVSHTFTSLNLIEEKLAHNWAPKPPLVKCTLISTKLHKDLQPGVHSSHGDLEEACLCTPGFSDIDFAGPLSLWWLLWIPSPRNMHVDMHAIWGLYGSSDTCLWILGTVFVCVILKSTFFTLQQDCFKLCECR